MATRERELTCRCGAKHWVRSHSVPMRDIDSFTCEYCGHEYWSWSGGVIFEHLRSEPPATAATGRPATE